MFKSVNDIVVFDKGNYCCNISVSLDGNNWEIIEDFSSPTNENKTYHRTINDRNPIRVFWRGMVEFF